VSGFVRSERVNFVVFSMICGDLRFAYGLPIGQFFWVLGGFGRAMDFFDCKQKSAQNMKKVQYLCRFRQLYCTF
jgi:hypothetical protein